MRVRIRTLTIAMVVLGLAVPAAPASAEPIVNETVVAAAVVFQGTANVTPGLGAPVCTNGTTPPNPPLVPCPAPASGGWSFTADTTTDGTAAALTCGHLTTEEVKVIPGPGILTDTTLKRFCTAGAGSNGTGVAGSLVTLSASGSLGPGVNGTGPWCGGSSGSGGTGTARVAGPNSGGAATVTAASDGSTNTATSSEPATADRSLALAGVGWTQSAATLIVATGTATTTTWVTTVSGPVVAVVSAAPDATAAGSCTNGTGTQFVVAGAAAAVLS